MWSAVTNFYAKFSASSSTCNVQPGAVIVLLDCLKWTLLVVFFIVMIHVCNVLLMLFAYVLCMYIQLEKRVSSQIRRLAQQPNLSDVVHFDLIPNIRYSIHIHCIYVYAQYYFIIRNFFLICSYVLYNIILCCVVFLDTIAQYYFSSDSVFCCFFCNSSAYAPAYFMM